MRLLLSPILTGYYLSTAPRATFPVRIAISEEGGFALLTLFFELLVPINDMDYKRRNTRMKQLLKLPMGIMEITVDSYGNNH